MATDVPGPDGSTADPTFAAYAEESVPQMDVGAAGKVGELDLTFAVDDAGTTRLVRDFARVPYHVSGTLGQDPHPDAATVVVQSPTGGLAQGDRLDASVEVGPAAIAHVATQSATKVQSMDANCADSTWTLSVAEGAHLDYVPEPTILFPDARFRQTLTLRVADDASAIVTDVLVPGRLARGERFDFERYHGRVRGFTDGRLRFEDAVELCPAESDPSVLGVMGESAVHGTCYVVDPAGDTAAMSDVVHERLADAASRAGVTTLPNDAGVVVRLLGDRVETVRAGLLAAWDTARHELIGAPSPDRRRY